MLEEDQGMSISTRAANNIILTKLIIHPNISLLTLGCVSQMNNPEKL